MTDTYTPPPRRPLMPSVPGPKANSEKPAVPAVAGLVAKPPIERPAPTQAPFTFGPIGNIAKGISGVMAEVGTIHKGGWNQFHRYHYARMEDLLQALTPLIGKHGLAIIQNEVEIKQIENRVAVTYEFSIIHSSGEMWPERPRFTGMCIARNSKGDWDDKALNKCHTSARKYFLLGLFQVPSGDFDDADEDANQRQDRRPVPGPKTQQVPPQSAGPKPEGRADRSVPGPKQSPEVVETGPHKIVLGLGTGADQWASAYIKAIGTATTTDELAAWEETNDATLAQLAERYSAVYDMIEVAFQRRLDDLSPRPVMPDPKVDSTETLNWVAAQLQQFNTYEAAEAFWNQIVAPREADFDPIDWEMLMAEWQRNEVRLAPEDPAPI
jgi:ERF superfamily